MAKFIAKRNFYYDTINSCIVSYWDGKNIEGGLIKLNDYPLQYNQRGYIIENNIVYRDLCKKKAVYNISENKFL